ncbi:MAG TPA: hypothetical protein VMS76_03060, partial [Planctomycetota bacterium]|nr:hypothetical protein [Planctomycetota bacterium]
MQSRLRAASAAALLCATAASAHAQYMMVVDSTSDRVLLFDAHDGALVNASFIVDDPTSAQYNFQTPKDAIQVGDQVWVSDQLSDAVYRFDLNGNFVGAISGGMDNIRGMELVGSTVYVTNAGTGNGAPGSALVRFDTNGNPLGSFPVVSSPFDVIGFQGDLLVSSSDKDL